MGFRSRSQAVWHVPVALRLGGRHHHGLRVAVLTAPELFEAFLRGIGYVLLSELASQWALASPKKLIMYKV